MNKDLVQTGTVFLVVSVGIFIILGDLISNSFPDFRMMFMIMLFLIGWIGLILIIIGSKIGEGFPKGIPVTIKNRKKLMSVLIVIGIGIGIVFMVVSSEIQEIINDDDEFLEDVNTDSYTISLLLENIMLDCEGISLGYSGEWVEWVIMDCEQAGILINISRMKVNNDILSKDMEKVRLEYLEMLLDLETALKYIDDGVVNVDSDLIEVANSYVKKATTHMKNINNMLGEL